jgi:sulfur carrier protein
VSESRRSITVNGEKRAVEAATVAELLLELGFPTARPGIAVAVEGALVPKRGWGDAWLADGQTVEIITAAQGG